MGIQQVMVAQGSGIVGSWATTGTWTASTDSTGWNGYTLRGVCTSPVLANGSKIRFTLRGPASGSTVITNMYVQRQAASGDSYDFLSTPVAVTFSGSASVTLTANQVLLSDEITVPVNVSGMVYSAYFGGTTSLRQLTGTGRTDWNKNANDASTVNATGYSNSGIVYLVQQIDVFSP